MGISYDANPILFLCVWDPGTFFFFGVALLTPVGPLGIEIMDAWKGGQFRLPVPQAALLGLDANPLIWHFGIVKCGYMTCI